MIIIPCAARNPFPWQLNPNVSFVSWHHDSILIFVAFVWFQTAAILDWRQMCVCVCVCACVCVCVCVYTVIKEKKVCTIKNFRRCRQQWKGPVSVCLSHNKQTQRSSSATKPCLMRNSQLQNEIPRQRADVFWGTLLSILRIGKLPPFRATRM
jgi:hypothetical protein